MDEELQIELLFWARRVMNLNWSQANVHHETPYVELDKVIKDCYETLIGRAVFRRELDQGHVQTRD